MLEKVKIALRLKSAAFDSEIKGLIAAAYADLRIVGIVIPEIVTESITNAEPVSGEPPTEPPQQTGDPLIERAVILYCKGHFGYIENGDKFLKAYDLLKCSLCLAGGYGYAVE